MEEALRELDRIARFAALQEPPELFEALCRSFLLAEGSDAAPERCAKALEQCLGLSKALRRGERSPTEAFKALRRCFSGSEGLRWRRIFQREAPVKLEICSGNGDWVVAQAKRERESDWGALELRQDRLHSIFSRVLSQHGTHTVAIDRHL